MGKSAWHLFLLLAHLHPDAVDLPVAVGEDCIPLYLLAVDQYALHALADALGLVDLDLVYRAPEPPSGCDRLPVLRQAGVHLQPVIGRPDAQYVHPEDVPLPGRPTGEPGVRALPEVL